MRGRVGRDDLAETQTIIQRVIGTFNGLFVMGGAFERRLVALAQAADMQGVVCGHSHKPGLHRVGETIFANCGDWVDNFTALGEDETGQMHLIAWQVDPARRRVSGVAGESGFANERPA